MHKRNCPNCDNCENKECNDLAVQEVAEQLLLERQVAWYTLLTVILAVGILSIYRYFYAAQ